MSLLNQMLTDLEQRRSGAPASALAQGVHSVAVAPRRLPSSETLIRVATLVLAVAAGAAYWLGWLTLSNEAPPAPAAQAEAAAETTTAAVSEPAPTPASERQKNRAPEPVPEPYAQATAVAASSAEPPAAAPPSATATGSPATLRAQGPTGNPAPVHKVVSLAQRADDLYRQALLQLQQGKEPPAVVLLLQTLALHPDHEEARQTLAVTWLLQSRRPETATLLLEGLQRQPAHPAFSHLLARVYWEEGDLPQAQNLLQAALARTPTDPQLHGLQAVVAQQLGQHPSAAHHFLEALRSDPSMPQWLVGLATSWATMGMKADAQEALERALQSRRLPANLAVVVEQQLESLR